MFWKWYWKHLTMTYVQRCGCMDIHFSDPEAIDRWIVCEEHSVRIKEIVAKRKPLPGTPLPIEE